MTCGSLYEISTFASLEHMAWEKLSGLLPGRAADRATIQQRHQKAANSGRRKHLPTAQS